MIFIFICSVLVGSVGAMDMEEEDGSDLAPIDFSDLHAVSKTFHWLLTLFFLLIIPSISTILVFAGKHATASVLQVISAIYATLEAIILRFPDRDGYENVTSRGTAWFLAFFTVFTAFVGSLTSGTHIFLDNENKSLSKWASRLSEKFLVVLHKILSILATVTGWVKVCMAVVAMFGFCYGKSTGQCIAHGIMGSSFVLYGFYYTVLLIIPWIRNGTNSKQSPEMFDSIIITVWGFINTWTEHRWGKEPWNMGDYQHTSMGIVWWSMGLLGIYLSRGGRRSFIPAVVLMFTGYSMSEHTQHLAVSTKVHSMFGLMLMSGGLTRIIEIGFLLKDERSVPNKILSFQYFPAFLLIESGILFMGANEEQLELVTRLGSDHSAYILVLTSAASLINLWFLLLLQLYLKLVGANELQVDMHGEYTAVHDDFELDDLSTHDTNEVPTPV
ncbi:hypothetical protein PACTADRAFT_33563 [Pachysolen tannophilus NRRL Y-2460]|uniref:Protein YTP1-like C-terminal domain-containing protein n=1 Tax=Pachysolen tannophilus NRRL Y-2460 TaxID=669874 RepID=A0A1E4TXD1_PACTA|nr:hypothetical protein PACTADRAFT_33563 [Pachysolen tannophilus NRRL Y-2460]